METFWLKEKKLLRKKSYSICFEKRKSWMKCQYSKNEFQKKKKPMKNSKRKSWMECQYSENEFQKKKKPMKNSRLKMDSKSLIWETLARKKHTV